MVGIMARTDDPIGASEAAKLLGVDPKTITRYAQSGRLPAAFRTPGGHRRWLRGEILQLRNTPADPPKEAA